MIAEKCTFLFFSTQCMRLALSAALPSHHRDAQRQLALLFFSPFP